MAFIPLDASMRSVWIVILCLLRYASMALMALLVSHPQARSQTLD
ncbi:MAG: hypothetical protein ACE1Y1_00580 [Nitrosomonadaceae bacterium]